MSFLRSWHSRAAKLKLLLRSRYYTRLFAHCGKGLSVFGRITVYYPDRIRVGNHCTINEWCIINAASPVTIGDRTRISAGTIITTAGLEKQADPAKGARLHLSKEIHIGKNVWIGARAVILPGVTIGDNSIIGAGAVVSKDIPADVVAMGVPARVHSAL